MIQRQGLAFVEDRQVMVGVAGHPDHITHGQDGAAAGQPFAGGGFEVGQGCSDDD